MEGIERDESPGVRQRHVGSAGAPFGRAFHICGHLERLRSWGAAMLDAVNDVLREFTLEAELGLEGGKRRFAPGVQPTALDQQDVRARLLDQRDRLCVRKQRVHRGHESEIVRGIVARASVDRPTEVIGGRLDTRLILDRQLERDRARILCGEPAVGLGKRSRVVLCDRAGKRHRDGLEQHDGCKAGENQAAGDPRPCAEEPHRPACC